jgi:hypothetical protein
MYSLYIFPSGKAGEKTGLAILLLSVATVTFADDIVGTWRMHIDHGSGRHHFWTLTFNADGTWESTRSDTHPNHRGEVSPMIQESTYTMRTPDGDVDVVTSSIGKGTWSTENGNAFYPLLLVLRGDELYRSGDSSGYNREYFAKVEGNKLLLNWSRGGAFTMTRVDEEMKREYERIRFLTRCGFLEIPSEREISDSTMAS